MIKIGKNITESPHKFFAQVIDNSNKSLKHKILVNKKIKTYFEYRKYEYSTKMIHGIYKSKEIMEQMNQTKEIHKFKVLINTQCYKLKKSKNYIISKPIKN